MFRKRVIATLAVVAVVLVVAAGAVTAQQGSASNRHGSGNQLAGTWIVTVERPPAPRPLIVLQHWNKDGTYLSYSGNGTLADSPAGRSHEFGSWERIEGRLYASSGSWLRYDTTGAHIGSNRADRTIRLSDDGDSFEVVTRVRSLDLDGNVIMTGPARHGRGERMQIERIPDEP